LSNFIYLKKPLHRRTLLSALNDGFVVWIFITPKFNPTIDR